jgi:hypothetical protein
MSEVAHEDRVFTARKEKDRLLKLGSGFANNEDGFGFQFSEIV